MVERANKEVAIEALLNTFEEVWLSRQLELVTIGRTPLAINRQEVHISYSLSSSSGLLHLLYVLPTVFLLFLHLFFTTFHLHSHVCTRYLLPTPTSPPPQTVSELGLEGQPSPGTPKSRIPSARVTSAVRRSQQSTGRASSPSPSSIPHHSSSHPHTVQLLHNTEGIFETLESHQVRECGRRE